MSLPFTLEKILELGLNVDELISAITERRLAIRQARDFKRDDRCHLDDHPIWAMIAGTPPEPNKLPPFEETMKLCRDFYIYRRTTSVDPISVRAIRDKRLWDSDLTGMLKNQLVKELYKLQQAIKKHRDISGRHRTVEDDRLLYKVLPEKMPADFRLPSRKDFLGEGKAPYAGCPSFIRSHDACPKSKICNLHAWGPCLGK